jgi:hypothetical protein
MAIEQISVFVENKSGKLAEVTDVLASGGIDLRAMSIADTMDYGVLRVIVDNPVRAQELLRNEGLIVAITQVLAVSIPDRPGGLAWLLKLLAEQNIAVEYLYAFIARKSENAYVILRIDDVKRAEEYLVSSGVKIAAPEDLYFL